MEQLHTWFIIVGGFALLGGTIDFFIGKKGQTKVRDWLELRWYRLADVEWSNLAKKEAEAYLRIFDRLAGKSLITKRRILLSFLVSGLVTIISTLIPILTRFSEVRRGSFEPVQFVNIFVISAVSFGISLSITRTFTRFAVSVVGYGLTRNILWFLAISIVYYLVSELWAEFSWALRGALSLGISAVILGKHTINETFNIVVRLVNDSVWAVTQRALYATYYLFWKPLFILIYERLRNVDVYTEQAALNAAIISTLATVVRFAFAFIFLVLFTVQGVVRGPILLIWARLVENEKPVFTLFFGGIAALGKGIETALSLI